MNPTLRIAQYCCSLFALQPVLMLLGASMTALAFLAPQPWKVLLMIHGPTLVTWPAMFLGGVALRDLASRRTMRLRPNAQRHLLRAALLVTASCALIFALSMWVQRHLGMNVVDGRAVNGGMETVTPAMFGLGVWCASALLWLAAFTLSTTRWFLLFPVLVYCAIRYGTSQPPLVVVLSVGGAIGATALALRIMNARQTSATPLGSSQHPEQSTDSAPIATTSSRTLPASWSGAAALFLGSPPADRPRSALSLSMLLHGALALSAVALLFPHHAQPQRPGVLQLGGALLLMGTPLAASIASCLAPGYARHLWLRVGGSREALFRLADRSLLRQNGALLGSALLGITIYGLTQEGARHTLLLSAAAVLVCMTALFHYLGANRGAAGGRIRVLAGIQILVALFLVQPVLALADRSHWFTTAPCAIAAVLTLLLHQRTHRRWRTLDWRTLAPRAPFIPFH